MHMQSPSTDGAGSGREKMHEHLSTASPVPICRGWARTRRWPERGEMLPYRVVDASTTTEQLCSLTCWPGPPLRNAEHSVNRGRSTLWSLHGRQAACRPSAGKALQQRALVFACGMQRLLLATACKSGKSTA